MKKDLGIVGPTRTCVGCGRRDAQARLLRLRPSAGSLAVAPVGSGRSAYVHGDRTCIGGLLRSKGLAKSLRAQIAKEDRVKLIEDLTALLASPGSGNRDDAGR